MTYLLCDVSTLGNCQPVVDDGREFPEAADFFSELGWCQTALARRELEVVVEAEFLELPCCANAAGGLEEVEGDLRCHGCWFGDFGVTILRKATLSFESG